MGSEATKAAIMGTGPSKLHRAPARTAACPAASRGLEGATTTMMMMMLGQWTPPAKTRAGAHAAADPSLPLLPE